ncbi:hypothetical protein [Mycobacteroides abscessus]
MDCVAVRALSLLPPGLCRIDRVRALVMDDVIVHVGRQFTRLDLLTAVTALPAVFSLKRHHANTWG